MKRIRIIGDYPGLSNHGLMAVARKYYKGRLPMRIKVDPHPMADMGLHTFDGKSHAIRLSVVQCSAELDLERHIVSTLLHEIRHAWQAETRYKWYHADGWEKGEAKPRAKRAKTHFSPIELDARAYENRKFREAWEVYQRAA